MRASASVRSLLKSCNAGASPARSTMWRTLTRSQQQLMRDRVRLHSQVESLWEDAKIKLATVVSDLLGVSSRRRLEALAEGRPTQAH